MRFSLTPHIKSIWEADGGSLPAGFFAGQAGGSVALGRVAVNVDGDELDSTDNTEWHTHNSCDECERDWGDKS